ncbi:MAG TPA: universal stress protein [Gaiellaceae bacterium]|nr:universal stress protein [Gaiellaceae bacterium]
MEAPKPFIVVGTDGSPHAERALEFAAVEARRRDAVVHVVTAWHVPAAVYRPGFAPMMNPSLEESTRQAAEEIAARAAENLRARGLDAETSVCHAQAAEALVQQAEGADLLVVGSRGHGGFSGLLLGSVSQQCAHHAPCPTMIVR